jgi:hypothetical protein
MGIYCAAQKRGSSRLKNSAIRILPACPDKSGQQANLPAWVGIAQTKFSLGEIAVEARECANRLFQRDFHFPAAIPAQKMVYDSSRRESFKTGVILLLQ